MDIKFVEVRLAELKERRKIAKLSKDERAELLLLNELNGHCRSMPKMPEIKWSDIRLSYSTL